MVQFENEKMIITIEQSNIDELQALQTALIKSLVHLSKAHNFINEFESESYYLSMLLENIMPDYDILKTGFENTPKNEFFRLRKPLSKEQNSEILYMIYQFDKVDRQKKEPSKELKAAKRERKQARKELKAAKKEFKEFAKDNL